MEPYSIRWVERSRDQAAQLRLAAAIRARREALGLTQRDVVAAGGPALSTLRQIEAAKSPGGLSRDTTLGLDRALRWVPGSAAAVLAGREELAQLDTKGWPTSTGDWAAYVQQRQVEPSGTSAAGQGSGNDETGAERDRPPALQTYSDAQLIAELARRLADQHTAGAETG